MRVSADQPPGYKSGKLIDTTVKVVSWNLWWRFGDAWKTRQTLIEQTLRTVDADIVALQEVWADDSQCQARALAEALGYEWVYDPASRIDGMDFGNAILSRWALRGHESCLLPSMPSEDGGRNCRVLMAELDGPRGPVNVWATHLSYRPEESHIRQRQVAAICTFVNAVSPAYPPVVCGDFNAVPVSEEARMMTGKTTVPVEGLVFHDAWELAGGPEPGFTWDNANHFTRGALTPSRRLDYIFVGEPLDTGAGHAVAATLIGTQPTDGCFPSDHYGVLAALRY